MMKKALRLSSGITLIELLAAILLVGVVFGAGVIGVVHSTRLFKSELLKHTASDELETAFEWIRKDAIGSNEAITTTANEVTLSFEDFGVNPSVTSQIRYYVKTGTTELYRQEVGAAGDGKLITDMIDASNLPVFSKPAGSNYLVAEMWIVDLTTGAATHRDMGVMLRCRETAL